MRIRSLVLLVAIAVLAVAAPVNAAFPAAAPVHPQIPPPITGFQVVKLGGPGGIRGTGFMDYTDDACSICDGKIVVGLSPAASYRIAASPDACGVPYVPATRIYAYTFKASARGTYWNPRREVTPRSSALPISIRVLKGKTGTNEVACGATIDLTDDIFHPGSIYPLALATFDGPDRHGIAWALTRADGRTDLTAVFADVPGDGPLRLRATTGPCSMTGAALFTRALTVSARHTAARTETVDNNEAVSVEDLGSMQLGAASSPFTRVRCSAVNQLATVP